MVSLLWWSATLLHEKHYSCGGTIPTIVVMISIIVIANTAARHKKKQSGAAVGVVLSLQMMPVEGESVWDDDRGRYLWVTFAPQRSSRRKKSPR